MKTVFLDTNFLLIPAQFKIDIFSEIERICDFSYGLAVTEGTVAELEGLARGKGKEGAAAKLGLMLLENKSVSVVGNPHKVFKGVDDFLLETARKGDAVIATMDRELKKRLRQHRVPLIVMRNRAYLQLLP